MNDMFSELDDTLTNRSKAFFRIGTGELTDSLTFDHITELGPDLVNYFSDKKNAIIELKSKNVHIDKLLDLNHNGRAVISWSMNSAAMRDSEEPLATSLDDRLLAAAEVQKAGYKLGFHFDPMLDHPEWRDGYRETIDNIFSVIKPENIVWISLGALRYPAPFEDVMRENHPQSKIFLGELLPGVDKKSRYFQPIRVDMFSSMYKWIRSYSEDVFVYLCMESQNVWQKSFGWSPKNSAELKRLLDDRVR
jgi:spore photoproduct lyase